MNTEPLRHKAKYHSHCKYCGKEFMAKRRSVIVCDSNQCQRRKGSETTSKRYVRTVKKKADETGALVDRIKYLERCINHEILYNNREDNKAKIQSLRDELQELYDGQD